MGNSVIELTKLWKIKLMLSMLEIHFDQQYFIWYLYVLYIMIIEHNNYNIIPNH